ncbi:MAG: septum site-determining protein MinC [Comamonadaceae bacterium]|nr:MAG: septum site-determining protein MinC [Comamonadaceae bacterium]
MTTDSLALDFKSATLYAVRVVLHSANMQDLTDALDKRMHDAGSFFENEPVVIDASRVEALIDWQALVDALRAHNLPPIGAIGSAANAAGALAVGLAHVELSTPPARAAQNNAAVTTDALDAPVPTQPAAAIACGDVTATTDDATAIEDTSAPVATDATAASTAALSVEPASATPALGRAATAGPDSATPAARAPQSASALVITKPLRSGQRVYARHSDLIVIGMVSQGAEVIADGNIHVYGPLRGKAMAGARGDASARIFTTELDAELLAVAGVYRVVEARLDNNLRNRPALVRLDGDSLRIESLKP